jgi:drug/metabolite transporter (DMT)-like permease
LLIVVVAVIGVYVYMMKKVDVNLLVKIAAGLIGVALLGWSRLKYLKWKRTALDSKLKQS